MEACINKFSLLKARNYIQIYIQISAAKYLIICHETGLQYSIHYETYGFYKTAEIGFSENVEQIHFKKYSPFRAIRAKSH